MKIKNSTSVTSNTGIKGIHYREDRETYEAKLFISRKGNNRFQKFIGHYKTLKEAKKARKEFILALF